jgi:hypothetical protein
LIDRGTKILKPQRSILACWGASCSFAPFRFRYQAGSMSGTFNTSVRIRRQAYLIHCSNVPSLAKRRPTLLWASGSISLPLSPVWLVGWRDPVCTAARWRSARQGRAALRIIDGVGKTRPRQPVLTGSLRQAHRGQRDHNRVRRAMSRRRRQFLGPFGSQLVRDSRVNGSTGKQAVKDALLAQPDPTMPAPSFGEGSKLPSSPASF